MTNQPPVRSSRSYRTVAAAIIITAVIISATIFATSTFNTTVTRTSTQTTTEITTLLVTSSRIATLTATNNTGVRVYEVTFQQVACGGDIVSPWAVTLGSQTIIKPTDESIPTNGVVHLVPTDPNSTMIIFSVPLGTYSYTLSPSGAWYFLPAHGSGSVTVTGSDVMVRIPAECHP